MAFLRTGTIAHQPASRREFATLLIAPAGTVQVAVEPLVVYRRYALAVATRERREELRGARWCTNNER